MTLTVAEPYGPASEDDLRAVESALGLQLPPSYRSWMLRVGGGELARDEVVPGSGGDALIGEIDPVADLVGYRELESTANVPAEFLVVTLGQGGCLALRVGGDDEGSVWWADTAAAGSIPDDAPAPEIMRRLADDFDAFLELFSA